MIGKEFQLTLQIPINRQLSCLYCDHCDVRTTIKKQLFGLLKTEEYGSHYCKKLNEDIPFPESDESPCEFMLWEQTNAQGESELDQVWFTLRYLIGSQKMVITELGK